MDQPHNKRGHRKKVPTKQLNYFFLIVTHFAGLSHSLIIVLKTFESFKTYAVKNTTQ